MKFGFNPQPKGKPSVIEEELTAKEARAIETACRAKVDARDHRRCFWKGCKSYANEKHHIIPRSLGGRWVTENILSACTKHHRYFKAGLITVSGNPDKKNSLRVHVTVLGEQSGVKR